MGDRKVVSDVGAFSMAVAEGEDELEQGLSGPENDDQEDGL